MIRLWCSVATLIGLICLCATNAWWADTITSTTVDHLAQAQKLAEADRWQEARDLTKTTQNHWQSQKFWQYILLRHEDLDQITVAFQSVSQYLEEEDKEPYTANNAQLMMYLTLIAEMEQCSLENIL